MLTADLVHARRRGDELRLVGLDPETRAEAVRLAARLVALVRAHVGRDVEALQGALAAVDVPADQVRLKDGLSKLLEDRCTLEAPAGPEPETLRRAVFERASAARAALDPGDKLDRTTVLSSVAQELGIGVDAVEAGLFADLRGAQIVATFDALGPEALVALYERAQAQAVLLRAVKVTATVRVSSPAATRALFRRLKFLRLLHVITRVRDGADNRADERFDKRADERDHDGGYRIEMDGPFSLFESVTKYGQKLAMVLPVLEGCESWKLEADLRWGKERRPLVFRLQREATDGHAGEATAASSPEARNQARDEAPLPDEVAALVKSFRALGTSWKVAPSAEILELPDVGLTVPDLVFERRGGVRVHLEVLGYWSRAAVWKRVELVQAGLADNVLFAVSSRLRVSEEVLEEGLPGALYVYKGTMSARVIAERLDSLTSRK